MNSTSIGFDLWPTVEGFAAATDEPLTTTREAFVDAIKKNVTNIEPKEIYIDRSFLTMMSSLVFAMIWVIYISYYNSRIVGYFITKALNRFFMSEGYATVGSFTLCALSGKIMFRDITYITKDYSVRVQDGWMIFRWWRAYVPKDVSEDLSHSDTRLSVMLNGFELHVFNRSAVYGNLEHLFDVDPVLFPWDTALYKTADERQEHDPGGAKLRSQLGQTWRDLIPVIKVDVSSGRLVFGNRLVPTTLSVLVEEAHFVYSTKPAASRLDHFMHFAKCKAENFKVILAPSPKYHGISDEPPRYMGEGFVVLSSNNVELYYYMDEPGLVPEEPEMLQLANGDIVESAPPIWGMDIKCGKGTDFSYGPWADRQREHLFKFFFPQDFQPLKVTKAPLPGEKRMVQSFDIRLSTLHESTIDILFSKNKETNAVHVNIGPGSYMEMTMPWVVSPDGYTTKVTGQLLHVEATTSLTYRSLMSSETLEFALRSRYPIKWNGHQEWLLHLTGCKATVWFIYAHKEFFQDMVNDWSCKARPDLLYFVPYTWRINVLLKEFEFILPCNEYNWIDCSSQSQENMCIAFCGELFDFSFDLPFVDFLPASLPLRFWIQGESMDLSMYLPEVFTTHCIALALDRNAKLLGRDGNIMGDRHATADHRKWRNKCQRSNGWLDCWSVPIVALSINYTYHPMPPYGPAPQADITTPEKEEILLSPMRIPRSRKSPALHHWRQQSGCPKFDPASLPPDRVSLELEIGPSVMLVYGAWIRAFVNLKENIFGDDQSFTDMNDKPETPASGGRATGPGVEAPVVVGNGAGDDDSASTKDFDPREYRPLDVVVSITMHDVHAHLVKNCNEDDPPCPIILLERFGFEMKKGYKETQLQLLLSPAILLSSDRVSVRGGRDTHLAQGHLMLSGLQVRGQAMFSDEGRGVDQETLEYAWLLEIQLGRLTGKMTTPQIHHLVTGLETLLMLLVDSENRLVPARSPPPCHHGLSPPSLCADSDPHGTYRCPSPDDIKYRMVRVAVDAIDLYVLESGTAINIYAAPIRVSTCNLHGHQVRSGMTAVVPNIRVRQTVAVGNHFGGHATATGGSTSNTNTTGSGRSQHARSTASSSGGDGAGGGGGDLWLEVGSLSLGPLVVEAAVSLSNTDRNLHLVQHKYLKTHDEKSKRLWFLWTTEKATTSVGKCGCIGGCVFFGKNRNGQHFFKPSRQDAAQGINIAAFRINETGKDPGFGQSILHEAQLVFHTPPYNSHDVTIHEPPHHTVKHNHNNIVKATVERERESSPRQSRVERSRSVTDTNKESPVLGGGGAAVSPGGVKTALGRRFSYTSVVTNRNAANGGQSRDVPYARLVDSSPTTKLDSDSRLHSSERARSILSVPEAAPKSSVSDSKLAVDYFNTTAQAYNALINSVNCAASSVMSSESEHSLTTGAGAVEVERSLCSENQSEAFFSAEEELSGGGGVAGAGSRTSSLRHSLGVYRTDSQATRKLFGSDMSIVAGSTGSVGAGGGGVGGGLSSHRSDHEIHTPEHRSNARLELSECEQAKVGVSPLMRHHRAPQPRSISPRYAARDSLDAQESALLLLDSSDTHSVSSTSFISAVSSQEDLALVNLHMQVNKPIVESPLLMSSYVNHLSQVGCANWSQSSLPQGSDAFTVPLFQRTDDGRLVYVGSKYTPRFETLVEGFTSLKMVGRHCGGSGGGQEGEGEVESPPGPPSSKTPTHPYCWDRADLAPANDGDAAAHDQDMRTGVDEELLSSRNESGSRTTLVVKMKGDIDIMVSPLALESLQRFIDAATPTLVTLHPLSVLNHLHLCCSRRVEAANVLKRDKYLGQLTGGGSKRSTAERTTATAQTQAHGVYEECIATQIQGTITLPKVNIALLQASVVEEVIAFSALDNLRDLTCVSLLAVAFDGVTARFHYAKQAREVVQTFQRPAVLPGGQKKQGVRAFLLGHQASQVKDILTGEPVYIETSEKQQEESVVTLRINKIHSQLRRLRNESTILKDAVITAIPAHCSRVMFTTCSNTPPPPPPPPQQPTEQVNNDDEDNVNDNSAPPPSVGLPEDKLGFIMFECGLEGVSLKVVKRSKFDKEEDEMKNLVGENETNYTDSVRSKEDIEVSVVNETGKQQQQPPTLKHGPSRLETPNSAQNSGADTAQVENATEAATSGTAAPNTAVASKGKDGNASSCVVEVKQVWFNFAAPPRAPITRKIDYTRLDWNLLSTASPAINAWMNPSNRFAIRVVHMLRCRYRRATAIVTCLMAQALDVQAVHVPVKSRYGRLTPLSVTLQEDPSCQLCTVLQRYVLRTTGRDATAEQEDTLEDNLHEADVPHLSTLRQGVIVLSRQWKNILYTPLLLEHNFKSKNFLRKPMNVTFAIPDPDEENGAAVLTDGEGEGSGEECEVTDECAMLLNQAGAGHHGLHKVLKAAHKQHAMSAASALPLPSVVSPGACLGPPIAAAHPSPHHLTPIDSLVFSSPTSPNSVQQGGTNKKRCLPPSQLPSSSRASIVFPLLATGSSTSHPFVQQHRRADSHGAAANHTAVFGTSGGGGGGGSQPGSVTGAGPDSQPSLASLDHDRAGGGGGGGGEDLYTWMAKHQEFDEAAPPHHPPGVVNKAVFWSEPASSSVASAAAAPPVAVNPDSLLLMASAGYSLYPMHDSLRLLDAHLIFEPLLSSLGVMPQQMITNTPGSGNNTLDSWGSNLSLVGGMEAMRIDIVVSEFGKPQDKRPRSNNKNKSNESGKQFWLDLPPETPAFVCERVGVELEVCRAADMTVVEDLSRQRRNMLYVSRGQLKKHSSTALNLSVSVRYIAQQVNMPLLRLLHQISNMYQNVKETQTELKEQQPPVAAAAAKTANGTGPGSDAPDLSLPLLTTVPDLDRGTIPLQSHRPVVSPSSSVRSSTQRHTSFAQRLRSTGKSVRGYLNLGDGGAQSSAGLAASKDEGAGRARGAQLPRCWKTVYYLLDLYATMPETKTIAHSRFSVAGDHNPSEGYKGNRKYETLTEDVERGDQPPVSSTPIPPNPPRETVCGERTRLVVLAVAKIHRCRLLATLSGLKLEAEITGLHGSVTARRPLARPNGLECSVTGHVGRTMIVLLEGVAPNQQTVVRVTVGKSQSLYSSVSRRSGRDKNSGLLTIGAVAVDIPQHPVALHGMMTRGSKQLSSTLQELRVSRTSGRMSRGPPAEEGDASIGHPQQQPSPTGQSREPPRHAPAPPAPPPLMQPLVMQFSIVLQSLSVTAALLPSLQAQYKMDRVTGSGVTGTKAKLVVDLPHHSLSFSTKVQVTEANLPSEASIELPKVHVSAEYVVDQATGPAPPHDAAPFFGQDGVVLRHGNYVSAVAEIGTFEHSLTTDLLNHLVFVQKVFMKEVNEVVQKVYGGEKPVPLWLEDSDDSSSSSTVKQILFTLVIRIKRIQLTATTPTNCAVRLETGAVDFQLSNRVQNVCEPPLHSPLKVFGKAQVDVNLSLGQVIRNVLFEEAEPEFQQFAFFKTRIGVRNAFQGETGSGGGGKEVVLMTLKRPLVYVQPLAVDKAILVWLNYKNAYDYWAEQRSALNKEVLTATQQVFEKVPFEKLSTPHLGTLFLQLTVEDMGICVPLNPLPPPTWGGVGGGGRGGPYASCESDSCAAVVVTLESTSISACSSGSLVSNGRFVGLCLRFADDFETSLDDWKPADSEPEADAAMNLCVVSEGTYEVCSRTVAPAYDTDNAKWFLNVQWAMEGVDIHLDVNIGKQLSALGHTLTTLTSVQEEGGSGHDSDSELPDAGVDDHPVAHHDSQESGAASLSSSLDAKSRSRLIEKEMYEQAKIINDLRALGASHSTIEQEMKRLRELEAMVYKGFRRDMIQRLRRQSVKSSKKNKAGTFRSKSFIVPSPTIERHTEIESPDEAVVSMTSGSVDSSPRSGPSRSASLRAPRGLGTAHRVTFSDTHNMQRQASFPSASSELSLPVDDWTSDGFRSSLAVHKSSFGSADGSTLLLVEPDKEAAGGGGPRGGGTGGPQKPLEPNIDFELDVKVLINRGKCVLHTKDPSAPPQPPPDHDHSTGKMRMKKERSSSGGMFEFPPASPVASRRSQRDRHNASASSAVLAPHRRHLQPSTATASYMQPADLTVFHIPGLDVKVHYESKTVLGDEGGGGGGSGGAIGGRRSSAGTKKASLFAWTTLQSIPEETIISPHILEFLEQTLEPIPPAHTQHTFPSPTGASSKRAGLDEAVGPRDWAPSGGGQYAYASFPVDVIVYFHMQPSTFRFSCLPVSRVECMLKLPSLDIVFSSKRAETESTGLGGTIGGLSITGCLADFSVYIFHPYGGKKSGGKEAQWSLLADSERKDSLSVNVEFVKFHLSRSRKLNNNTADKTDHGSRAIIRFSTVGPQDRSTALLLAIIDIGSASFKYDMRRLTEILAFPKAWYRRSIVRRLFLGDFTAASRAPFSGDSSPDDIAGDYPDVGDTSESSPMLGPNRERDRERERLRLNLDLRRLDGRATTDQRGNRGGGSSSSSPSPGEAKTEATWETLVLFAVNFKRLNVHMNMGNVMGNVMWLTKNFRSEGRLSIGSTGHKNMFIGFGLGGSSLEAKGGIVGGTIELSKIDTFVLIREDPGTEPDHTVGLKLASLELRLDYMGTAVLMCRVSALDVSLRDEWKMADRDKANADAYNPTRRSAMIFVHGDLGWDQLQLMISKSTTVDLLKMYYKLDEFFSQQFKSSKRVFSALGGGTGGFQRRHRKRSDRAPPQPPQPTAAGTTADGAWVGGQDARHHRHWQPILSAVAGLRGGGGVGGGQPLPPSGTVLGGTMELHGTHVSLACFHGINFKSKSWALFSLKEPCISFTTEAQEVHSLDSAVSLDVHIVQTLTFSLGAGLVHHTPDHHHSMAAVCKVSRNVLFPPQFRALQEWFHYAFSCSDIDEVDRFPSVERERDRADSEGGGGGGGPARSRTPKQDLNHTREVIFALPSLQLHLKTEHWQATFTPDPTDEKPTVECSFVTEFEDHIFVTVDAEAFFFLHDLIISYIREKDRAVMGYPASGRTQSPELAERRQARAPEAGGGGGEAEAGQNGGEKRRAFEVTGHNKDWRNYHCKTWHLEPTVRLLSWGGKSIEPYGVDYILQKLGFSHARSTIPKWMQRGFMDPLDKVLAVLVLNTVQLVRDEDQREGRRRR